MISPPSLPRAPIFRLLLGGASFVIVIAGIKAAASLLDPFLLSAFLAIISAPLIGWLRRRGLPRQLAVLILLLGWIVVGACLLLAFSLLLAQLAQQLPSYEQRLAERQSSIESWLSQTFGVTPQFSSPHETLHSAQQGVLNIHSALSGGIIILAVTLLLLLEAPSIATKLRAGVGAANVALTQFGEASGNIKTYMRIYSQSSLVNALILTLWLLIFRVDYAILWGLAAAILSYIPYLGSTFAMLPAIVLSWIQYGLGTAAIVTVGVVLINLYFGQVTTNQTASRRLNLSLLAVFLSLVFWTWVLGPPGALLGVPLTAILKIIMQRYRQTRWAALLLTSIIGIQGQAPANQPTSPETPRTTPSAASSAEGNAPPPKSPTPATD